MVTYKEIIEAVVEREMEIIGRSLALRLAKETENLEINDEAEVLDIKDDGKKVLDSLISKYEETSGNVAVAIIARAINDAGGKELDLPEKIRKKLE